MARSSNRVGMFSSNRGRMAKRWLIAFASLGLVLFFGNAMFAEPSEQSDSQQTYASFDTEESDTPTVAAPIAEPFARPIPGGVEEVQSGDIYGNDVEHEDDPLDPTAADGEANENSEESGDSATDELQRTDSYQSAVTFTQKFASAYGTYSPAEQSAQEWVDSLPGLESSAKERLLGSVEGVWSDLVEREVSSEATAVSQSVEPIWSRDGGSSMQLSVSVTKETSFEGDQGFETTGYVVTLERSSDVSSGWMVVAVE